MTKKLLLLLCLAAQPPLHAFDLPSLTLDSLPPAAVQAPASPPARAAAPQAAASFAAYPVNGVAVAVPNIGCGNRLLAALKPGSEASAAAALRKAFGAAPSAGLEAVQPQSRAELELAAQNPGAAIVSLNPLLPPNVAALFNREPNFGGPNCFNAAFTAAGMMPADRLRHVGNPEADQMFAMYYKQVQRAELKAGDIAVLNDGDHAVYYLGGGLVFHKKSYLKQHIYRITRLEKAYEPEPYEWKPSPFDGGGYNDRPDTVRRLQGWRPTGAQYQFGPAGADEIAKAQVIAFLQENVERQAPRWAFAKEMGYFTERLLENLVDDWSAMARSPNPVLRAYYHRLESFRDQANQSIETELLSSPHAQANAYEVLKRAWLPRNGYSRELVERLLEIYGKDRALTDRTLDAIAASYEGSPLERIKAAN